MTEAAGSAVVEMLEQRRLLASVVQSLPFAIEFDRPRPGITDSAGRGTGFTLVQGNSNGNEYQPARLVLRPGAGVLNVRTVGNASNGTNYRDDNSLVNGLQTQFNALSGPFSITVRIRRPGDSIDAPEEQAGILFGPEQDAYVKFVAASTSSGLRLQLLDEQRSGGSFTHLLGAGGALTDIGAFSSIQSLDLVLVGDPDARTFTPFYRIDGGQLRRANGTLTIPEAQKSVFFRSVTRAGIMAAHKNDDGGISVSFDRFAIDRATALGQQPSVTGTRPGNNASNVARDAFVAADLNLPNAGRGVDTSTLTSANVKLYRTSDNAPVQAIINTSGGGDVIVLQPVDLLAANTRYTFEITSGVTDTGGNAFVPYTSSFTTGTQSSSGDPNIAFEQVELGSAQFRDFTSVDVGPDGRLYATTLSGQILRWRIRPDGTLADRLVVNTVANRNGAPRLITGLAFDPRSTASNVIVWITHGESALTNATDWTGKVSKLWGSRLERYTDAITGLPRSVRDHLTNQPRFGPDGGLYFPQGSMSAMGAPDSTWALRGEHLLSAAILRLDIPRIESHLNATLTPVNVQTSDGGTYNPFRRTSPLRIWATGVRNAYDLVFHSNGQLYAPTNGSASGGATPATPSPNPFANNRIDIGTAGPYTGPNVPGIGRVTQTQADYLFRIEPGGYYGHPNPTRSEFVLNGGNPTSGVDANEVTQYPVGTQPDRNYRGAAYRFGNNYSPNGIVEYTNGTAFGGALEGKLIVTRYSGGDDLLVLDVGPTGNITGEQAGIVGLTHFADPLDVTVDPRTGNLYVVELAAQRITLVRPVAPGAKAEASATRLLYTEPRGGAASPARTVTIRNTGTSPLVIQAGGISISGSDAAMFNVVNTTLPATIAPGGSFDVSVNFNPTSSAATTLRTATLNVASNDPDNPVLSVRLRGLPTLGTGGANEPSLQRIFDLYELPLVVGDSNPDDALLNMPPNTPNDELDIQQFVKASGGPVTVAPIAAFATTNRNPAVRVGWYDPGSPAVKDELFTIPSSSAQTVDPATIGSVKFDPGSSPFSLFGTFPGFTNASDGTNREVYQEDSLNTWEPVVANRNKVRVYPLKDANGNVVADSYVLAFEEFTTAYDNQDVVLLVRNVRPVADGPELGLINLDNGPWADRLVMSRVGVPDAEVPNQFHDFAKVQIRNTGNRDLVISSLSTTGPFSVVTPTGSFTVPPGGSRNVTVQFTQNSGVSRAHAGNLTIASNDADESQQKVELLGYFSSHSEITPGGVITEPTLPTLLQMFGFSTVPVFEGQSLDTGGRVQAVGEEVLSPYFLAADPGQAVVVHQLSAYREQGALSAFRWFAKGTTTYNFLFSSAAVDGQTVMPRRDNDLSRYAFASFKPTTPFGFRVDNEWSDPELNVQEQPGGGFGHHFRIYPVRDRNGQFVPDALIVTMDYRGFNYDYQDNIYLVTNIRPENRPTTPIGLTAMSTGSGMMLTWGTSSGAASYNVYRSTAANGPFTAIASGLTARELVDNTAEAGGLYFYRVTAVSGAGVESLPHSVIGRA